MLLLKSAVAELAISLVLLAVAVAVAAYVIGRVRRQAKERDYTTSELLSKFRDLHSQGGLSEQEYRTIKTRLTHKLLGEVKDKGEKG